MWKEAVGPGWVLVGDAGTAQDPWSGLGMDTAARQAEAFVEAFTASPRDWHGTYTRLRRERTYAGYDDTTRRAPNLRKLLGLRPAGSCGPGDNALGSANERHGHDHDRPTRSKVDRASPGVSEGLHARAAAVARVREQGRDAVGDEVRAKG